MRKLFLGLVLALSMVACTVPSDYFEKISNEVASVIQSHDRFMASLSAPIDAGKVMDSYVKSHDAAKAALDVLQNMSACSGNDAYRQSAVDLVSTYVSFYESDFSPVLEAIRAGGNGEELENQLKSVKSDFATKSVEKTQVFMENTKAFMKEFDLYKADF